MIAPELEGHIFLKIQKVENALSHLHFPKEPKNILIINVLISNN